MGGLDFDLATVAGLAGLGGSTVAALGAGEIEVTALKQISLSDITPALARKSGFAGVVDLLKIAKHGPGENVYLVEFVYHDTRD